MSDDFRSEVCMSGNLADLPRIAEFVDVACDAAAIDSAVRFDLQLAVEEACMNVIEHAYGGKGGEFTVCIEVCGPDVEITVTDHGRPFDPLQIPPPNLKLPLEERPAGGLGIYLMQKLMDDVEFIFSAKGNQLKMVKRGVRPETG